ncbi:MAG: hypothetical protein ACRDIY_18510, partial [Chloroflexota bacterium]
VDQPGATGRIAALYRRMTDPGERASVVSRFPDATRLVFTTLAQARRPLTAPEIGRALPFAEEAIDRSLATIEATGLAWRVVASGRERATGERRWFVPRELCDRPAKAQGRAAGRGTSGVSAATLQPPEPGVFAGPPPVARSPGVVATAISALLVSLGSGRAAAGPALPGGALAYAEHCGGSLGVLTRRRAGLVEGPRADAWRQSAPAEQVRALARLWLVDEQADRDVPEWIRRRLWDIVKRLDQAVWYDLSSVAAAMAWRATINDRPHDASADQAGADSRRWLARRQVDRAIEVLGWIGVITLGDDGRGRPVAIQIAEPGKFAVE